MSVIIKKENNQYVLYGVSHDPSYIGGLFNDFITYFKYGKIIPFSLPIEEEIDLYFHKTSVNNVDREDFVEVNRIPMYGKGDICTYVSKQDLNLYNRENKLKRILQ